MLTLKKKLSKMRKLVCIKATRKRPIFSKMLKWCCLLSFRFLPKISISLFSQHPVYQQPTLPPLIKASSSLKIMVIVKSAWRALSEYNVSIREIWPLSRMPVFYHQHKSVCVWGWGRGRGRKSMKQCKGRDHPFSLPKTPCPELRFQLKL